MFSNLDPCMRSILRGRRRTRKREAPLGCHARSALIAGDDTRRRALLPLRKPAVTIFADPTTPGPIRRVSFDDWAIDFCPHHGPSLALGDGIYQPT
jgi:hypothetical protein